MPNQSKRVSDGELVEQPALKKSRLVDEDVAKHQRATFMNKLRAKAERWTFESENIDGKDVIRIFLRENLKELFPLRKCDCHHKSRRPEGIESCKTGGIVDAKKAQGFVASDFDRRFRNYLASHEVKSVEKGVRRLKKEVQDEVQSWFGDDDDEADVEIVEDSSQFPLSMPPASDFDEAEFPSSSPVPTAKRKSTKQRLTVLYYLLEHSGSRKEFEEAWVGLQDPELQLVHLCGCGLSYGTFKGACVVGSHMKLATAELNREHAHFHFILRGAATRAQYLQQLACFKGSHDGRFDDVF